MEEIPRGETESRKVEWNREDLKWVLDLIERDSRYSHLLTAGLCLKDPSGYQTIPSRGFCLRWSSAVL